MHLDCWWIDGRPEPVQGVDVFFFLIPIKVHQGYIPHVALYIRDLLAI